jgi:hypothetical protein
VDEEDIPAHVEDITPETHELSTPEIISEKDGQSDYAEVTEHETSEPIDEPSSAKEIVQSESTPEETEDHPVHDIEVTEPDETPIEEGHPDIPASEDEKGVYLKCYKLTLPAVEENPVESEEPNEEVEEPPIHDVIPEIPADEEHHVPSEAAEITTSEDHVAEESAPEEHAPTTVETTEPEETPVEEEHLEHFPDEAGIYPID